MVVEGKRKAEDSSLVPVNKKQKNEVAVKSKNNQVLQAVSMRCIVYIKLRYSLF